MFNYNNKRRPAGPTFVVVVIANLLLRLDGNKYVCILVDLFDFVAQRPTLEAAHVNFN